MLLLMQLHANGLDSETAYAKAIRDWLAANAGRPRTQRRCHHRPARRTFAQVAHCDDAEVFLLQPEQEPDGTH
jgi:hypothetical protein